MNPKDPFLTPDEADRLANMIAAYPPPERIGDDPPSPDFIDGFNEAKRVACMLIIALGNDSGCAPVASH